MSSEYAEDVVSSLNWLTWRGEFADYFEAWAYVIWGGGMIYSRVRYNRTRVVSFFNVVVHDGIAGFSLSRDNGESHVTRYRTPR